MPQPPEESDDALVTHPVSRRSGIGWRFVVTETSRAGWVSVGTDHDTAAFAVQTIRRWWYAMGQARYPRARDLTINRRWWRQQRAPRATVQA